MDSILVKRLHTKAVCKVIFLGLLSSFVPIFTISGFLASADLVNMYWAGQPITGVSAIFAGPLLGLLMGLIFSLFISVLVSLGLMLYSKKSPLKIEYYPLNDE